MKRNVLEYLETNAVDFADKIAVIDEHKQLTYKELMMMSKRAGSAVAARTASKRPIAVLAEKGTDTLCAFTGIIQAGCFYTLLNPDFPMKRLSQMISILKPELIITDEDHQAQAEALIGQMSAESKQFDDRQTQACAVVLIEALMASDINEALLNERRLGALDTDPLYVNFTSGSTGIPKGVLICHRSVLDFIDVFVPAFGIDHTDIIGNQAPFDFDVSVKDIYSAMKSGATLVIIPKRLFSKPAELLDFLCDRKITTLIWAVSALCLITICHGLDYKVPIEVKRVLFSGEVMPLKHLRIWMEKLPKADFVNLYGPTEITCNCTYHRIDRMRDYTEAIPIGRAFPNEDVFLLDEEDKAVDKPYLVGEICVRGTALALGYYGDQGQTAAAFLQNPLNLVYPERIYRTGDLGKYTEDGELLFCGRKDFQIKYKGHRIELEEIEREISSYEGIERCCVIFDERKQKLYGFYVGSMDRKALYKHLKGNLPIYMIPGALRQRADFPLNKNGKIDRKRLLEEA